MKLASALTVILLAGCAAAPGAGPDAGSGMVGSNAPDSEARQRARTFTELAAAYYARAQYKIALEELRKAIVVDSRYGPAYNIYGLIYMELAEDKLAEENFRRAIELDRADSEAHNNYGWFLCTRGRHDEGLEQFAAALRNPLYSQPELAMANAGECAAMKGDLALAEANLVKSLKLQPDNPGTVLRLANLRFVQGRLPDAQRLLARRDELAPPTAASLWLAVRVERKLGDRAQEAAYGLQLRKRFPDSKEAGQLLSGQFE
ncbi:MAG: type IV pilus biogenesis/stability protein PilW [Thiobacillus sp.]|nr:type IV pilus biogenesis/stability protein PilW [Thiobacillus sp.]